MIKNNTNRTIDFQHFEESDDVRMTQMFMNLVFAFDVFEIIRLISPACKQVLDFTEFNGHWSVIFEIVGLVDFTKTAFADEPQALIFFAKDRPAFFG